MSTVRAIQAVTEALVRALRDARTADWPDAKVAALRGQDFANPPADLPANALGASVFLWRVGLNAAMRNYRRPPTPPTPRRRSPTAVDLLYLLSGWGPTAGDQHLMLAWALRALLDVGTLAPGLLNAGAAGAAFAPDEAVELAWEPTPVEFISQHSDLLKPNWPPTVVLVARGVVIESLLPEAPDGPPVQARAVGARPWDFAT
ncbi:MAG: DUF4255 domain-containing protein, partial [Gemmataceae bacterium]|nr:DUF4255 domain-containing protein [Gemmataceae bacterium]